MSYCKLYLTKYLIITCIPNEHSYDIMFLFLAQRRAAGTAYQVGHI